MSAPWLIVGSTFLFSLMAVCVKYASAQYTPGELVLYRSAVGAAMMYGYARWLGGSVRTAYPSMHLWRSASGVAALGLWFYAIAGLPLATAATLNYLSSVWMALFLVGGAIALGTARVDGRLIATVLVGFGGVTMILRPTIEQQQLWHGLMGLLSGVMAATAYLQVTALGRIGEPEYRVVFWFSAGGVVLGGGTMLFTGSSTHTAPGVLLLVAIGVLATVAQLMMTRAYGTGRALVNASLQYLGIAWSFGFGILLFDDKVTLLGVCGMLLVVGAGVAATALRSRNRIVPLDEAQNTL